MGYLSSLGMGPQAQMCIFPFLRVSCKDSCYSALPLRKFPGMAGESLIDRGDVGSCFPMPAQSKYCHEKVLLENGDGSTFG